MASRSPTEPAHAAFALLERAASEKEPTAVSPAQARAILLWANDVTERKNEVVRENMELCRRLMAAEEGKT